MTDLLAILTSISHVLGKRISELENSQKSEVNAIYDRLNSIASDVAYIKGRMEGEK